VTNPTGTQLAQFDSPDAFHATCCPIYRPARPPTLATGLEAATVFHTDGPSFREVRVTAPWDQKSVGACSRSAAVAFLDQYTIPETDMKIVYETFEPEFLSYFRHQTAEGIPDSLRATLQPRLTDFELCLDRTWRYHSVFR